MRTRDKLAAELRKIAAVAAPGNAPKYEAFAKRAETGEFDDYADTYVCPITQLHLELMSAGFIKFADRVASGEFDATREESDEWARSSSGQDTLRKVLGQDRGRQKTMICQRCHRDRAHPGFDGCMDHDCPHGHTPCW